MAIITAPVLPYLYTEAEAVPVENILSITAESYLLTASKSDVVKIKVTVGTFQFSSGQAITAESPTYTVGEEVSIKISRAHQLRLKAAATGNAFKASY